MTIHLINGSPKAGQSTSGLLLQALLPMLPDADTRAFRLPRQGLLPAEAADCEALVLAFPLYVDGIPSHLLRQLEAWAVQGLRGVRVYAVVNNGFFEGRQNRLAAAQLRSWARAAGAQWGRLAGIGAGEMLPFLRDVPMGHGPLKNIGRALQAVAQSIRTGASGEDLLVSPNWPRALWRLQADTAVWQPRAKASGLRKKDLYLRQEPPGRGRETP